MPFPHTIVWLAQFGYPLFKNLEKVKSKDWKERDFEQWTIYWIICALWMFVESSVLWFLVDYCPLFLEMKLAFLVWLMHPTYRGAVWLWYAKIQPIHKDLDKQYYDQLMSMMKVKIPDSAKPWGVVTSDKNEVIEAELKK